MEEVDGVDTERSRWGIASRASEGETLGDGELALRSGDVGQLTDGLAAASSILYGGGMWIATKIPARLGCASLPSFLQILLDLYGQLHFRDKSRLWKKVL